MHIKKLLPNKNRISCCTNIGKHMFLKVDNVSHQSHGIHLEIVFICDIDS